MTIFHTTSPFDAHTALRARALCLAFSQHERQAGKAKAFAMTNPSWACAHAPKMEEACEGKKTTALKKPSGGGVPRGVPLVPFLATSWGTPRSSINLPAARCQIWQANAKFCSPAEHGRHASMNTKLVRRTKERKLNFKQPLLLTRILLRAALCGF